MNLPLVESLIRWAGGLLAFAALGILMFSIWRGTRRPAGRAVGPAAGWLRCALFYPLALAAFLGCSALGWRSLPLELSTGWRTLALIVGTLVYFPGLALLLWGRLALGKMYFVSTSFGAQLYADHQLVRHGPYALVRHPMYVGLITAALGGLLIYQTWTTAAFAVCAPFVLLRARREEQALAAEFGEQWQAYCRRVPAFFPHPKRKGA
jgi:protein-S-isoprenylcysteine O-methyltransferase Ste14